MSEDFSFLQRQPTATSCQLKEILYICVKYCTLLTLQYTGIPCLILSVRISHHTEEKNSKLKYRYFSIKIQSRCPIDSLMFKDHKIKSIMNATKRFETAYLLISQF